MPLYNYYCKQCDIIYENLRSIKQRDIKLVCPECNERCKRIIDISSFHLIGDGWAKDGYGKKKPEEKKEEKEK